MTTITNTSGFTYSSTSIRALAEATGTRFVTERTTNDRIVYFADGYKFRSPKVFGEYMIKQANDWMIENGLVDLNKVRNLKRGGYDVFKIVD